MTVQPSPPDPRGQEAAELFAAAEQALHRDPARCAELLDRLPTDGRDADQPVPTARILQLRGELHAQQGRFHEAVGSFQQARQRWLADGDAVAARYAGLGRTGVLIALGDYDDAARSVERLLRGLDEITARDEHTSTRLYALGLGQLGDCHAGTGDHGAALSCFNRAENLYLSLGDRGRAATVALRRAGVLLEQGLAHRALDEARRARADLQELGWDAAATVAPAALALGALGQAGRGLELLRLTDADAPGHRLDRATRGAARSVLLLAAGLFDEAHTAAREAERLFSHLGMVESAARANLTSGTALLRTG